MSNCLPIIEKVIEKEILRFIEAKVPKWGKRYEIPKEDTRLVAAACLNRIGVKFFAQHLQLDEDASRCLLQKIGAVIVEVLPSYKPAAHYEPREYHDREFISQSDTLHNGQVLCPKNTTPSGTPAAAEPATASTNTPGKSTPKSPAFPAETPTTAWSATGPVTTPTPSPPKTDCGRSPTPPVEPTTGRPGA